MYLRVLSSVAVMLLLCACGSSSGPGGAEDATADVAALPDADPTGPDASSRGAGDVSVGPGDGLAGATDVPDGVAPEVDAGPDGGPWGPNDTEPDAPDDADATDGAETTDAAPDGQIPDGASDAGSDAADGEVDTGPVLDHPLANRDQIEHIFDLHTLAGKSAMRVAKRLFDNGTADCPGELTTTPDVQEGVFGFGCFLPDGKGDGLDVKGRLDFETPNACTGSSSTTHRIVASEFNVKGVWRGSPTDLYFDDLDYFRWHPQSGNERSWSGTVRMTKFPSNWFSNTSDILEGVTVRGYDLTRVGKNSDGVDWSGRMTIEGLGTVEITTVKPVATKEPSCFQPSQGLVRLEGAVDVLITYDGKGECALPTWTRNGVPMGELDMRGWGFVTICFSRVP